MNGIVPMPIIIPMHGDGLANLGLCELLLVLLAATYICAFIFGLIDAAVNHADIIPKNLAQLIFFTYPIGVLVGRILFTSWR